MISEMLGLAGSGILGSVFSVISDTIKRKQDREHDKVLLEIKREDARNNIISAQVEHFSTQPAFSQVVKCIVITYCVCCLLCICFPTLPIHTFNPEDTPRKFSIFGIFNYEWQTTKIYIITTGGVGYSLLHPLAFIIGRVVTGAVETR